jgi:hypothetical protein
MLSHLRWVRLHSASSEKRRKSEYPRFLARDNYRGNFICFAQQDGFCDLQELTGDAIYAKTSVYCPFAVAGTRVVDEAEADNLGLRGPRKRPKWCVVGCPGRT